MPHLKRQFDNHLTGYPFGGEDLVRLDEESIIWSKEFLYGPGERNTPLHVRIGAIMVGSASAYQVPSVPWPSSTFKLTRLCVPMMPFSEVERPARPSRYVSRERVGGPSRIRWTEGLEVSHKVAAEAAEARRNDRCNLRVPTQ